MPSFEISPAFSCLVLNLFAINFSGNNDFIVSLQNESIIIKNQFQFLSDFKTVLSKIKFFLENKCFFEVFFIILEENCPNNKIKEFLSGESDTFSLDNVLEKFIIDLLFTFLIFTFKDKNLNTKATQILTSLFTKLKKEAQMGSCLFDFYEIAFNSLFAIHFLSKNDIKSAEKVLLKILQKPFPIENTRFYFLNAQILSSIYDQNNDTETGKYVINTVINVKDNFQVHEKIISDSFLMMPPLLQIFEEIQEIENL